MPKLEANLQWMFTEYEVLDRYDAAAAAGFKGVELQAPYSLPINAIVARLERNHLKHVIINLPNADPDSGEGNIGLNPARKDLFRERLQMAVDYAAGLGCIGVNTGVGSLPEGIDPDVAWRTLVGNLQLAADALGAVGVKALVEAINTFDRPGCLVHTTAQAKRLIEAVGHPNIGIQYDFYHMQMMEGNLARTIRDNLEQIWHMQLADTPGRHEPGTGEINYHYLLPYLDEIGYAGWVGCEYGPLQGTEAGLGWAAPYLT
jgi:hydroxypyruvate isomerase